jgi:hypothetical protein
MDMGRHTATTVGCLSLSAETGAQSRARPVSAGFVVDEWYED